VVDAINRWLTPTLTRKSLATFHRNLQAGCGHSNPESNWRDRPTQLKTDYTPTNNSAKVASVLRYFEMRHSNDRVVVLSIFRIELVPGAT